MTVTMTPRRAALVLVAVIALTVVFGMGATRSGGAFAATSTFGKTVNTSSTQPSTVTATGDPGITVGGRADVAGTPDTLRLDLSVVVTAASVSEALAAANHSAELVQQSLLGNGVAKKDLQTTGLNIQPDYDFSTGGPPRLKGYQVSESLSAKLRDLGRAGDVIDRAVTAGGDAIRVNGISLDLEDTGALVSIARGKAFAEAKAKAEQYARAAGRTLGDVVRIVEDSSTPTRIPAAPLSRSSVPIQPGSQDVSVSVTVVFAMR